MKNIHPAFKILTVLLFVTLLSGFVAYRSGAFEPAENAPAVDTPGVKTNADTVVSVESFYLDETMSSSKSGAVFEEESFVQDTGKKQVNNKKKNANPSNANQAPNPSNTNTNSKLIMGSSKSGGIFIQKADTGKKK